MEYIESVKKRADELQQRHAMLAFPVAVVKRYNDDQAGKLAALITYYGFLALFPLLLVFMTLLGVIASGNAELHQTISQEVYKYFPALGDRLQGSVHTIKSTGLPLLLQVLALLYGARGVAAILQESFNTVWHVDKEHRPGFPGDNLRSFAMLATAGLGIIASTAISYALGVFLDIGIVGTILILAVNFAVIFGLLLAVFRLGTSNRIPLSSLVPGALIACTGALIVQHFGAYIMAQQLPKLSGSYGSFAFALAMMFWIYLQAQMLLYALEIAATRAQKDWPKKFFE